jgi:aspartate--ammonia ligase
MKNLVIPENYQNKLDVIHTEYAIKLIKNSFERQLANELNLSKVSAPLFVRPESGLNDDLNGVEKPVEFNISDINTGVQVVHSLAKWKRMTLKRHKYAVGEGIYANMNAIRTSEVLDNLHSALVDQWDWEKIITSEQRSLEFLKQTVEAIITALKTTQDMFCGIFYNMQSFINEEVFFITSQELEDKFPDLKPRQRENEICKQHKTVFVMQIGAKLKSGQKHDGRAPDYDDWQLNGDILIWSDVLQMAIEISSMGIRVDKESLKKQLIEAGCEERAELPFHKALLNDELPLTIGGGIGQSRVCMLLLEKAHIGEVQASVWGDEIIEECEKNGIILL